jgi:TonB-like protein
VTRPPRLLAVLATVFLAASGAGASTLDPQDLSEARDIRVVRWEWAEPGESGRVIASARAKPAWLSRLARIVLRDSARLPDTECAVACGRCPDQVQVSVSFTADGVRHHLTLFMRERLAFVLSDSAHLEHSSSAFRFADATDDVARLLGEVAGHKPFFDRGWQPPATEPAPLSPDSAAFRGDVVFATAMPEAVHQVWPSYPRQAREANLEGVVDVFALVTAEGTVAKVYEAGPRVKGMARRISVSMDETAEQTASGQALREAAANAVRAWTFKPATYGGQPIAVWVRVPVHFKLQD